MKGQISLEYLIIVGVALSILLPFVVYGNDYLARLKMNVRIAMAKEAVEKIGETADWVCLQGSPAKETLLVTFPDGIDHISIINREISFTVKTLAGSTDVYYISSCNLTGSLSTSPGRRKVLIEMLENQVNISDVV